MTREYHLHLPHITFDDKTGIRWLYANRVSRDIVNRATLWLLPIFLFTLGQQWSHQEHLSKWAGGMLIVAAYFALVRLLVLVIVIPISQLSQKMHHSSVLAISYLFRVLFFALLLLVSQYPGLLLVIAIAEATEISLFWPHYSTHLSDQVSKKRTGANLGVLQFLLQLLGVVTPLLAAFTVMYFGFPALFMLGIAGSLIGFVTGLQVGGERNRDRVSWREFRTWFAERRYQRYLLAVGGRLTNDIVLFLWSLYLFLLFGAIMKVGIVQTLSLFMALVVTVFFSLRLDKWKTARQFRITGSVLSIVWLLRIVARTPLSITLIDTVDKLFSGAHWLFFDMVWYRRAKGTQAFSFFVYHEVVSSIWQVLIWIVIGSMLAITGSWGIAFALASVGVMLSLLLKGKHGDPVR